MTDSQIVIGRVRSVTAGRRLLRVLAEHGREGMFPGLEKVLVMTRDGEEIRCLVAEVREEPGRFVLALTPGVSRDSIALMKGAEVRVEVKGSVPEAERTAADFVGLNVVDEAGAPIGTVTGVEIGLAQDVLEIERTGGRLVLVPAIEQVIAGIEWNKGVIVLKDIAPYAVEEDVTDAD